jgi:EAL domain-containing protein (putative c-di-GMP-specific phosphodiesterase class I)
MLSYRETIEARPGACLRAYPRPLCASLGATGWSASWASPLCSSNLMWTQRIADALQKDRFVLHAQPTRVLVDDSAGPSELLLRMVGEDGQLIARGDFIPFAERDGLIRDIDRWVARHAVAALAEEAQRPGFPGYAMNISGLALGDGEFLEILRGEFA